MEEHRRTRVLLQEVRTEVETPVHCCLTVARDQAEIEANSISESLLSINAGGSTNGVAEDVPRVSEEDAEEILQEVQSDLVTPLSKGLNNLPASDAVQLCHCTAMQHP